MEKLIKAIHFATIAHGNQQRKDKLKTPFINHPIEVMRLLSSAGVTDIDTLCAAVLHDTIEHTSATYEQLKDEFGIGVADIVNECSDNITLPRTTRKKEQVSHSNCISIPAKLVRAADKLSNIMNLDSILPTNWAKEEIDGYFVWSYAVWLNIRGCNKYLDRRLHDHFEHKLFLIPVEIELDGKLEQYFKKKNLLSINQTELDGLLKSYYEHINNPE